MSEPLAEEEELAEMRAFAKRSVERDENALSGRGPLVLRLLNENARLKRDLEAERAETLALLGRLAEVAPSDKEAAERAIRVRPGGDASRVSLEATPGDFVIIHSAKNKEDAEFMAEAAQHQLANVLAQYTAQIRAELATVNGRNLEVLNRCMAEVAEWGYASPRFRNDALAELRKRALIACRELLPLWKDSIPEPSQPAVYDHAVHCVIPTNVFRTPGGVEPEEWKAKH